MNLHCHKDWRILQYNIPDSASGVSPTWSHRLEDELLTVSRGNGVMAVDAWTPLKLDWKYGDFATTLELPSDKAGFCGVFWLLPVHKSTLLKPLALSAWYLLSYNVSPLCDSNCWSLATVTGSCRLTFAIGLVLLYGTLNATAFGCRESAKLLSFLLTLQLYGDVKSSDSDLSALFVKSICAASADGWEDEEEARNAWERLRFSMSVGGGGTAKVLTCDGTARPGPNALLDSVSELWLVCCVFWNQSNADGFLLEEMSDRLLSLANWTLSLTVTLL